MIREGTAACNLEALMPLLCEQYADRCMFCTDDKHPNDLLEKGHMDYIIKKAIRLGADPIIAVKVACHNAARYFLLNNRGAIAPYIRRGYPLSCFEDAVQNLRKRQIEVIVHTILGLPGESEKDILETMQYLNGQDIQGIKLQLLHVLKGTDLAEDYVAGKFRVYEREEYLNLLIDCLEHLDPSIVIHRMTGDGPEKLLIAPLWASRKREVLNLLHHEMKVRNSWQGKQLQ